MQNKKSMRIPMLTDAMSVEKKDWMKKIRAEIQHIRNANSKAVKMNNRDQSRLLDLEPAMEKRRIEALISSLEKQDEKVQKYAADWITINFFCINYAAVEADGHMMTAAAIWILDRLLELNVSTDKIYPLLPTDEKQIDDLFQFDVRDCRYDADFVASVEYVLHYRNKDIVPMERSGDYGDRIFTSNLAAEGKDYADVPSRQAFESLLELIPQWMKDDAVKQFEECFKAWTNRFFICAECLQTEYVEKLDIANKSAVEINELQEKLEKKAKEISDERKRLMKARKEQVKNKATVNPLLINPSKIKMELPVFSTVNSLPYPTANIEYLDDDISRVAGMEREIGLLLDKLKKLYDDHEDDVKKVNESIDKRGRFMYLAGQYGYLTSATAKEYFPSDKYEEILKPLPFTDPYAMCFALLYLVETGSDIPWLYGSCMGMMAEVIDSLPWGMCDYDELKDPYWDEVPPVSNKTPDFPDWYKRDYCCKGDDEYDARSLAQIVYEATGCLMPRDIHRYDAEIKKLGKYGIKQNKAIAILYCMLALSNSSRQLKAINFEPDYMKFLLDDENDDDKKKDLSREELLSQKADMEKQIQQLRSALHSAERAAEDAKKKLAEQKAVSEAEHRELADLREIIFNKDELDIDDNAEVTDNSRYPYTVQKSTVIFGGHESWVKILKPLFKGDIKFIAKEMKIDASLVRYADVIWIQTNAIPHRSYYSIVNTARKLNKPIRYFTYASAMKCAEQIVLNDGNGNNL